MRLARAIRKVHSLPRSFRYARMVARALKSRGHPILAHIIPIRRCNLACAYCSEYDRVSSPVPTSEMVHRIDLLDALGTEIITFSGGEPLLHPDLDDLIRRIRCHGRIATLITNGYLLTPDRIRRLNRAGLEHLQISIDNVSPDDVSKKSLKVLDKKLEWLEEFAQFAISINSVVGAGVKDSRDALVITRRALELGFDTTVGVIHDRGGQLLPLPEADRAVYEQIQNERKPGFWAFSYDNLFQKNLLGGKPNDWQCRAGSRYLYICEDGLVHYCSQQRGYPAIPLEKYTHEDLEREYWTKKPCAPYCTVSCVHRVEMIDMVREDPRTALKKFFPPAAEGEAPNLPVGLKILSSVFLPPENGRPQSSVTKAVAGAVMRVLGIK
ncbi:radical SAM protein [Terriglobus albidus]|uniref:radical SAM protein n=1 Tax=Terriglobus albidus TaxID=1592106 RepID=UPI0021DFF14D|nr:radical SAM protein [Terriglobus albidus]